MTQQEAVAHWLRGAEKALKAAQILQRDGIFEPALFECHLCVEKALKAAYLHEHDKAPPPTHNLILLAKNLARSWTEDELEQLRTLSQFVIDARYADPPWAEEYATEINTAFWIERSAAFLLRLSV